MFDRFKRIIHDCDPELLKKLLVQKTKSGGYHLVYRCQKISGNLKLANRPTTDEERHQTYLEAYNAELSNSKPEDDARKKAEKSASNDKVRVLLETRGEGGYIMCYPTPGYELIHLDYYNIHEISVEERDLLHSIARQFNSVFEEETSYSRQKFEKKDGVSVFDDYNQRGDIVSLLQEHGWKVVGRKGSKTIFLRPGQTTSQTVS